MNGKRDNIYIYLWEGFNTIYIGRTVNPKSRHQAHRTRETVSTYKFSSEHGVKHPKMIIIESDLSVEEGVEREKYWINEYREHSTYNVLNKTKGGEVGGSSGAIKWTKDNVFEEAKKYNSLSQFKYNNNSAYSTARLNGWLKEMTWFKRPIYIKWTKEATFEEAKKYQTRRNFEVGSNSAYNVALKNRWLDEMPWLKIVGHYKKWTKELVFEESKKYSHRKPFKVGSPGAYRVALDNGWLDEMSWLAPKLKWNKNAVIEESKKYNSRGSFKNGNKSAYNAALKNRWIDEMFWLNRNNTPINKI